MDARFLGEIPTAGSKFSGAVDANLGKTPAMHQTRDLGMAMDLGIGPDVYINSKHMANNDSIAGLEAQISSVAAAFASGWDNDKALALSQMLGLVEDGAQLGLENNQRAAIRDYLSMYAVTKKSNGSLDEVASHISNQNKSIISDALFGGIVDSYVNNGTDGKNTYPYMRAVLRALGITSVTHPFHDNHIHMYLKPPTRQDIVSESGNRQQLQVAGDANLNERASPQMANTSPGKYAMVLSRCGYISTDWTYGDGGGVTSPDFTLNHYFSQTSKQKTFKIDDVGKVVILQQPTYGVMKASHLTESGHWFKYYVTNPSYSGMDKAIFDVEYAGKHVKVIEKFHVAPDHDTNDETTQREYDRLCSPKIIRVSSKDGVDVPQQLAVGETSYQTDWMDLLANFGAASDGKTELLSALLHEYGDALGIGLSGDDGDFMAASLQPGERRLPGSEELSLMAMYRLRRADYGWVLNIDQTQLAPGVELTASHVGSGGFC
ncbi:hypothetical protein [Undibacterium curvum]|uniref:Uncharacterized protein n=1 Tax=Undibacterium curvum TaxID=2762294 RepID=A0ABR7A9J4_9BURK|nr:hypothetical protein [Undibacterium curvum]MBC3933532.1 hypothetical protein [Undibacterium curvum]